MCVAVCVYVCVCAHAQVRQLGIQETGCSMLCTESMIIERPVMMMVHMTGNFAEEVLWPARDICMAHIDNGLARLLLER